MKLNWEQVDFDSGVIVLYDTKNKEPRAVPIIPGLMEDTLSAAKAERETVFPECPAVFAYEGKRLNDPKRSWATATEAAGVAGILFHDMRRSANRKMRDAGLPQGIRMRIMGHKTTAIGPPLRNRGCKRYSDSQGHDLEKNEEGQRGQERPGKLGSLRSNVLSYRENHCKNHYMEFERISKVIDSMEPPAGIEPATC